MSSRIAVPTTILFKAEYRHELSGSAFLRIYHIPASGKIIECMKDDKHPMAGVSNRLPELPPGAFRKEGILAEVLRDGSESDPLIAVTGRR